MTNKQAVIPANSSVAGRRRVDLLWAVELALVTLVLLWPSAEYDALNYDDPVYLSGNGYVQKGLSWEGVEWALWDDFFVIPIPLTWISLMATTSLLGDSPAAYRIINILLHLASVALVFLLVRRMVPRDRIVAIFVAAVFAWHPTRLESVIWISERKDVLSGMFLLLTLHGYLTFKRRPTVVGYCGYVLLPFLLSLFSKPSTVVIPALLVLLDFWRLGKIQIGCLTGLRSLESWRDFLLALYRTVWDKLPPTV